MELLMFVRNIWPCRKRIIAESINSPYLDIVQALSKHCNCSSEKSALDKDDNCNEIVA